MTVQFFEDTDWFRAILSERTECDFSLSGVSCRCTLRRVQSNVIIEGHAETTVDVACSRCLEVTHLPIKSAFRYTFMPADEGLAGDRELSEEDLEFSYYRGDVIELDRIVFEQIILQIPMKVLCSENCKGLCPRCGANLNISVCGCKDDFVDERFAVLKSVKI